MYVPITGTTEKLMWCAEVWILAVKLHITVWVIKKHRYYPYYRYNNCHKPSQQRVLVWILFNILSSVINDLLWLVLHHVQLPAVLSLTIHLFVFFYYNVHLQSCMGRYVFLALVYNLFIYMQIIQLQQHHWYLGILQSIATPCAMERNTVSIGVSFPDLILIPLVPLLVPSTALKVFAK